MNKKQIKETLNKHKKTIIMVGSCALAGALSIASVIFLNKSNKGSALEASMELPDFKLGDLADAWTLGDKQAWILQVLKPGSLGELGAELVANGLVSEKADLSVIVEAIEP